MSEFRAILEEAVARYEDVPEPTQDAPEQTKTTTETSRKRKQSDRKRGDRGLNKFPDKTYKISDVSPKGQPLAPEEALPKFRNALGFLVRDNLDITIRQWRDVSDDVKNQIWNKLLMRFVLPRGSEELVKEYTMKQLAINFRNWRSEMNTKFAKKGLDPTKKYKISAGQWAVFLEQRSSPDFISLSEANSELSKKNKYRHHLGTGGYKRQVPKWRQEDAEKKAAGLPTLSEQLGERAANWLRARKPRETETGVSFDDPIVEEAAKNIYTMAAKQSEGTFKPQRERDILTAGLGNPEHPGRVRGISSKEGWKEGFGPQWEGLYKKRDRYKEEMADYFKEEAKKEFKAMMSQMLSNPPPELMQQLASAMSVQQMTTPQIQIIPAAQPPASTDCTTLPSSVASTGNKDRYPVDDITRPVACTLVIRYGINNKRTKKVATGLAIPGRKFHGNDIPEEYCRVEVTTVVQGYEDDMLDIPGPEGIETLGQAIKNFILWPRRDVELLDWSNSSQAQPSPPSQIVVPIVHPSSPPQTSHAAPHPFSDPPSPPQASPFRAPPPSPPHPLGDPLSTPPSRDPPSPQPSNDPRPSKKSKLPIPKLVSPYQKKKSKATTAGTVRFLKGIGRSLTSQTVDLAEHEESAKKAEAMAAKIKKPTKADYKNVPKKYVPGRPLLPLDKLRKVPAGVKRLHDWYMRASSVGIDTISVHIPDHAFIGSDQKAVVTFEDMWLMMNLQRLDVQLVTMFAL